MHIRKTFSFCCLLAFAYTGTAQISIPRRVSNSISFSEKAEDMTMRHIRPAWSKNITAKAGVIPYIYDIKDGEAQVFAQLRYDMRLRTTGLVAFSTFDPDNYTLIHDYGYEAGKTSILTSGTYVGNEFIAYETVYYTNVLMPEAISVVDVNTGEYKRKKLIESDGSMPLILDEMTYDPKTDKIFAIHYDSAKDITDLYSIDRNSLEIKKIASLDVALYTLSADNGYLYGIYSANGGRATKLARIEESSIDENAQTAILQTVSPSSGTGITIGDYSQSMEFDKTTHRLWWMAQASDDLAYLVEMSPETGTAISKKAIKGYPQILAMGIPYQFVADKAPSYPRNFSATTDNKGTLSAQLRCTTPDVDYRNGKLNNLSGIKVYRNNELINTINETSTDGKDLTWTDSPAADGFYTYKIVPFNEAGDGVYKEYAIYVGMDYPGSPDNVILTATGNTATITWNAPSKGKQGGYYDTSTLKYNVTRLPDNVQIARGTTSTSVTDEVASPNGYSYEVTAVNDKGEGGSATSNILAFGPANTIPFISPLNTQEDFNRWTAVDQNNDNNTWYFHVPSSTTMYDRNENAPDDWLYTPSLTFDKNKQYQVRYTYASANWVSPDTYEPVNERMKVWLCEEPAGSGKNTLVNETGEFHTASNIYLYGKDIFRPATTGFSRIAFQACSDAERGQIYLKDISIREYSQKDLSVSSLTGSTLVNSTIRQTYTVTVHNEGSAAVSLYKVRLVNADNGEIIAETDGKKVNVDESVDIPVNWIPGNTGTIKVKAEVVLDGDTYPADNISSETLNVEIKAADEDKWITVNTDNSYGWRLPFFLYDEYSKCQTIFLEKELQKKNITITGVRFVYNNYFDNEFSFNAKISVKNTELQTLSNEGSKYTGTFEDDNWTKVYDGTLAISGKGADKILDVNFTTPFKYEGGNLNFMFECPLGSGLMTSGMTHPEWHMNELDMNATFRNAYYSGKSEAYTNDDIYSNQLMPYMSISYKDGTESGIITVTGNELTITTTKDYISLSKTCESVQLLSHAGTAVFRGTDTSRICTSNIPAGVYILNISSNGKSHTYKIAVK